MEKFSKFEEINNDQFNPMAEQITIFQSEKLSGEIHLTGNYVNFNLTGVMGIMINNPILKNFKLVTNA